MFIGAAVAGRHLRSTTTSTIMLFPKLCRYGAALAAAGGGGGVMLLNSSVFIQQQQPQQQQQFSTTVGGKTITTTNVPASNWRTVEYFPKPTNVGAADDGSKQQQQQETPKLARKVYGYYDQKDTTGITGTQNELPTNATVADDGRKLQLQQQEAPVKLARKIVSNVDNTGLGLRLYQYQTCPYCCKLRAFLDYFGFSYEVVEVNPVTRSQISFSKDYKKVPILRSITTSDEQQQAPPLVESSLIVSVLATFLVRPEEASLNSILPLYPEHVAKSDDGKKTTKSYMNQYFVMWGDTPLSDSQIQDAREEREWREWVDAHFIHLISPNVYRSWRESLATFRWFERVGDWHNTFPAWERVMAVYVGAAAMFGISKRLKKRHGIVDEREAMQAAFKQFLDAKGPHRKFLGGDQPNLADLALYGACNSFAGCSTFTEMRQLNPGVTEWFDAVDAAVKEGGGRRVLEAKSQAIGRQIQQQQKQEMPIATKTATG